MQATRVHLVKTNIVFASAANALVNDKLSCELAMRDQDWQLNLRIGV
jgi:hypothetical protein